jgi:hypothetical protein
VRKENGMPQDGRLLEAQAVGIIENSPENEKMMLFGRKQCRNSVVNPYVNAYHQGTPLGDLFE